MDAERRRHEAPDRRRARRRHRVAGARRLRHGSRRTRSRGRTCVRGSRRTWRRSARCRPRRSRMYRADCRVTSRAVVADASVARVYGYEKALFDFDSKHITKPGNKLASKYLFETLQVVRLRRRNCSGSSNAPQLDGQTANVDRHAEGHGQSGADLRRQQPLRLGRGRDPAPTTTRRARRRCSKRRGSWPGIRSRRRSSSRRSPARRPACSAAASSSGARSRTSCRSSARSTTT